MKKKLLFFIGTMVLLSTMVACNPSSRKAAERVIKEELAPGYRNASRAHHSQQLGNLLSDDD